MLQLGAKVCICAVVRGVLLAKKVIMEKKVLDVLCCSPTKYYL